MVPKVDDYLTGQGLQKSSADQSLYFHEENDDFTLLVLYVDHVYLTKNNLLHIARLWKEIQTAFDMTELVTSSYSSRIEFLLSPYSIRFTQLQYIKSMLANFRLSECRHVATSMIEKTHLLPHMRTPHANSLLYQTLVGKLIFLDTYNVTYCLCRKHH